MHTIVIGTQFGDEGKGKLVDVLAKNSDYVIRYQGGNNAGHTIQIGDVTHKLHLIPSGVFYGKEVVIGNGVVVDPDVLLSEIDILQKKGIYPKLHLSDRAHLILPYHVHLSKAMDEAQGKLSAGSTQRGIAPSYVDKSAREGLRVIDLFDPEVHKRVSSIIESKQKLIHAYGSEYQINSEEILSKILFWKEQLRPYCTDTSLLLHTAIHSGKQLLFEGAQATFLDIDHGIYPFSTSSNPTVGGAFTGSGVFVPNPKCIGIVKAYLTRVGKGPVVTELHGPEGDNLREAGGEYGTTTGRPRRCGWLDLVMVRYSIRINSLTSLALTKLDVLTGLEQIKVCIAYIHKGKVLRSIPANYLEVEEYSPVYVEFKGWKEDITNCKKFEDLPLNAQAYVSFIENEVELPIEFIGVGKERGELIVRC